jgi:hypothetical protein
MKTSHIVCAFLITITGASYSQERGLADRNLYQWGEARAGLRVGLWHSGAADETISVALGPADPEIRTNYVPKPRLYFQRSRPLSISLRDLRGREVPKTAEGRLFREPHKNVTLNYLNSRHYELVAFFGQIPHDIASFRLDKCFDWKAAGVYELQVRVSVLKEVDGPRRLRPLALPVVKLQLSLPERKPDKLSKGHGPASVAGLNTVWFDYSYQPYLRFTPDGADSIPITLGRVEKEKGQLRTSAYSEFSGTAKGRQCANVRN